MKSCRSSLIWFFIDNVFYMRYMKMKMTPSFSPRRDGSDRALFYLEISISNSDFRSGQVKVKS